MAFTTPFKTVCPLLLFFLFMIMGLAGNCFAATNTYYLDQTRMEMHADPKTNTVSGYVKLTSNSSETIRIKVVPKLWTLDDNASIRYLEAPTTGFNLLDNLLINPQEFELPPAETRLVRFMVRLPDNVKDAEYPFQLVFEPSDALLGTGQGASINNHVQQTLNVVPVFTTTIYAYQGNPQPDVRFQDDVCTYNAQNHQVDVNLTLNNAGEKHARLYGKVIVNRKSSTGDFQPVDIAKLRAGNLIIIFPQLPRKIEAQMTLKTPLSSGTYRLDTQLSDERNIQAAVQSSCDLVIP